MDRKVRELVESLHGMSRRTDCILWMEVMGCA